VSVFKRAELTVIDQGSLLAISTGTDLLRFVTFSKRGKLRSAEHCLWVEIRQRCENKNDAAYKDYGGRGIRVCKRWQIFENFISDVGRRPSPAHTLGRKDNDGDYSPGNVRWETRKQQARNRRTSRFLVHCGKRLTVAEWAERKNLIVQTLHSRLNRGWSISKSLTTSLIPNGKRQ
jgi:hypothetical protein